jgi:hypothetical protein
MLAAKIGLQASTKLTRFAGQKCRLQTGMKKPHPYGRSSEKRRKKRQFWKTCEAV